MSLRPVDPKKIKGNVFETIDDKWMLLTGGDRDSFNPMTISWGAMGILWNRPIIMCVVRPQRHTYGFMEKGEYFTVSSYSEEYRKVLQFCGTKSGRDYDKVKETGLTPAFSAHNAVYFEEAELAMVCKKIYFDDLEPAHFIAPDIMKQYNGDYHRMYIGEIVECFENER